MKRFAKGIIPISIILALWIIGSQHVNPLFLPKVSSVYRSFKLLLANGMLMKGIGISFYRITLATLLSGAISLPIGLLVYHFKILDDMVTPITGFMRYMPITAFYPLLIMWLGIEEKMKICFLFLATFFYFLPSVILSLKETSTELVDTALTLGYSRFKTLCLVVLPASLPNILKTYLMMYGIGWTYVVLAEETNARYGLGYIINVSSARGRTDMVFVALLMILTLSYLIDHLGDHLIKKAFRWKYARRVED